MRKVLKSSQVYQYFTLYGKAIAYIQALNFF